METDFFSKAVVLPWWFWLMVFVAFICLIVLWWPESKPKKNMDEAEKLSERLSKAMADKPATSTRDDPKEEQKKAAASLLGSSVFTMMNGG
ncbi:MAG: hypothetical protein WCL18_02875 [bacterium]